MNTVRRVLAEAPLSWLLLAVPIAAWMQHARPDSPLLVFVLACVAIVPLAGLLGEVRFAAIKGNISEIGFLAGEDARARGVDAEDASLVTEGSLKGASDMARRLSDSTGAVVVISGAIDIVAHAQGVWTVRNGHPLMARITGSGCMSAAVIGCCLGAAPEEAPQACLCAVSSMGVAGEIAAENMVGMGGGTGSYRSLLIDAMSMLDGPMIACRADVKNG